MKIFSTQSFLLSCPLLAGVCGHFVGFHPEDPPSAGSGSAFRVCLLFLTPKASPIKLPKSDVRPSKEWKPPVTKPTLEVFGQLGCVIKDHRLGGLSSRKLVCLTLLEATVQDEVEAGPCSPCRLQGEICSRPLFQLLKTPSLVAA